MDRENKKIKAGEHEVVIKTYLTAREMREIKDVLITSVELEAEQVQGGDQEEIKKSVAKKVDLGVYKRMEDKAIQLVIISVDGKTDKILETVLDFKSDDFDALMKEVGLVAGDLLQKKTK